MKNKFFLVGMFGIALAFGLVLAGCPTDGTNGGGGSLFAGKAVSQSLSVMNRAVIDGVDFGDFPVEDFSIRIDYLVGRSTETGYKGWGILNFEDESKEHVIPITSQIKIGDLGFLKVNGANDYCDYIIFDIQLLYEGASIANFPESMFIKGEELDFYQNPGSDREFNQGELRQGWKDCRIIFDEYPLVPDHDWDPSDGAALSDDFIVIPFDGIDLNRNFDLKFEWDISILVDALKDAKNTEGDYNSIQDRAKPYIQDFFRSFSLKVIYKD
ncbi:MAG: hypothetical protein LBR99_01980 [Treponema sp.]|jgi:hypothetical protein|nr:hypothetical protein [Treponema sp.]